MDNSKTTGLFTENEAAAYKEVLKRCIDSYAQKGDGISDKEWLKETLVREIAGLSESKATSKADSILSTISAIAANLADMEKVAGEGKSKEAWLAENLMADISPEQMQEQGEKLSMLESALYGTNMELSQSISGKTQEDAVIDADYEELEPEEYTEHSLKQLAMDVAKNASVLGLQSASSTAGDLLMSKLFDNEQISANQIIQEALKSGKETSLNAIASGALQIVSDNGLIEALPVDTPSEVIASIASMGVEQSKILSRIMRGELTMTQGLEQFSRVATAAISHFWSGAKSLPFAQMLSWIPVFGPELAAITGAISTAINLLAGTEFGKKMSQVRQRVASAAKTVAKTAVSGLKRVGRAIGNGIRRVGRALNKILS